MVLARHGVQAYEHTPLANTLDECVFVRIEHCRQLLWKILHNLSEYRHAISSTMFHLLRQYICKAIGESSAITAADSELITYYNSFASCILAFDQLVIQIFTMALSQIIYSTAYPELEHVSGADPTAIIAFHSLLEQEAAFLGHISVDTITVVDHLARKLPVPVIFCNSFDVS